MRSYRRNTIRYHWNVRCTQATFCKYQLEHNMTLVDSVSGLSRIQTISLLWLSFQTGTDVVLTGVLPLVNCPPLLA